MLWNICLNTRDDDDAGQEVTDQDITEHDEEADEKLGCDTLGETEWSDYDELLQSVVRT